MKRDDLRTRAERIDRTQADREQRLKADMPDMQGVDARLWGWAIIATALAFGTALMLLVMPLAGWLWPDYPGWFRAVLVVLQVVAALGLLKTRLGLWLASLLYRNWTREKAD